MSSSNNSTNDKLEEIHKNEISKKDDLINKLISEEDYNIDLEHIREQDILNQEYGLCPECNQPNTFTNWCKECYSKKFQQNFGNWTSGNEHIDKFIQEAQLKVTNYFALLEWIPYNRLRNIQYLAQGGFSTVYKGIWLDGCILSWDYEKQDWERDVIECDEQNYKDANDPETKNPLKCNEKYGSRVALKSLNSSSNINGDFLNEWKLHLQCQHKAWSNGASLVFLLGITQDPDTLNYMIVMPIVDLGSLRNNLKIKKYNSNDKFLNLYCISNRLESIHKLNLIHGDLHNGNILFLNYNMPLISDLGLCRPVNQPNIKNEIYGVLPYMAPEVLRGKPYTKASDIYSFGIIMWEMTSGVPAFHNISHDLNLSLDICRGIRPEIIKGTMPEYVELMKRCWDNDPKKRPIAKELMIIFAKWHFKYPLEKKEDRIPVPENEPKITYHPKSCYTSRKIDYSAKLNELLAQDDDEILIVNDDDKNCNDETIMSESLASCMIKD